MQKRRKYQYECFSESDGYAISLSRAGWIVDDWEWRGSDHSGSARLVLRRLVKFAEFPRSLRLEPGIGADIHEAALEGEVIESE